MIYHGHPQTPSPASMMRKEFGTTLRSYCAAYFVMTAPNARYCHRYECGSQRQEGASV